MQVSDLRKAPRLRAIKSGQVIIGSSGKQQDCMIRNISVTGAQIRFEDEVDLPDQVELLILSHNIRVQADVVWQTGVEAGLEFHPGTVD